MNEVSNVTSLQDVVSSLDFSAVTDNFLMVLGAAAGVVVGCIALRKGWSFLKSQIKGA